MHCVQIDLLTHSLTQCIINEPSVWQLRSVAIFLKHVVDRASLSVLVKANTNPDNNIVMEIIAIDQSVVTEVRSGQTSVLPCHRITA